VELFTVSPSKQLTHVIFLAVTRLVYSSKGLRGSKR